MWLHGVLLCLCGFLLLFPVFAHAHSLMELWQLARATEPGYRMAQAGTKAAEAREDMAFGALLPQLSASASIHRNDRQYRTLITGRPETDDSYRNHSAQLSLTQPLFRYASFMELRLAKRGSQQADFKLAAAEQELLAKLVAAWLEAVAARDELEFVDRKVSATAKLLETARRGAAIGLTGAPQLADAQARHEKGLADRMAAEIEAQLKLSSLEQLTGTLDDVVLPRLSPERDWLGLGMDSLDAWLSLVNQLSPQVLAAAKAVEMAEAEIARQRAGHYPTLDLVGSYGKNNQEVGGFPGQAGYDIRQGSVGAQLSIPIFAGGSVSAKVSEAYAQKERAVQELEAARRGAQLAAKQAWLGWRSAYARRHAGEHAIKATASSLEFAVKARRHELKTAADVLQAEEQHYAAERDYRKARYDEVIAIVRLKSVIGDLRETDISGIDELLGLADTSREDMSADVWQKEP